MRVLTSGIRCGLTGLGEALIARTLRAEQDSGQALLAASLKLSSEAQLERVLEVLTRLIVDQATENVIAGVVLRHHDVLVKQCAEQTRGTTQRSGCTGLLDGLTRLHIKLLTEQSLTCPYPRRARSARQRIPWATWPVNTASARWR